MVAENRICMETGKHGHEGECKEEPRSGKDNTQARGKQEEKKASKIPVVVLFLLLFTGFYVYTLVVKPRTGVIAEDGNKYVLYKGELVPLRAAVGECRSVPVSPSTKEIAKTLANTKKIILLFDPYSEDKYYNVNLVQLNLIAKSKYLNKPVTYAYTRGYGNSTEIITPDVLGLGYGNADHAVILMNQTGKTGISMKKEGQILIEANESRGYDRAVCALELSVLGIM